MRKLFVLGMVAGLVGMGGYVRDAHAGATVDLLFVSLNGASIAPTNSLTGLKASDTFVMHAVMTNDQTLTAAVFSINYDLGGQNTLDVNTAFQWHGQAIAKNPLNGVFAPLAPLNPVTPTTIGSFQGITSNFSLPAVLPPGSYQMGTVTWHANSPGDVDITSFIVAGIDGFGDGGFNNIDNQVLFRTSTVNIIPEPATASLLGLGLVGLLLMGRRSR